MISVIAQTALALLAAVGLVLTGWLLLGRLLLPVGGKDGAAVCMVLPARGSGEGLEHTVAGLLWLRGGGLARFPIILADCGLDEAGLAVAGLLAQRESGVLLCPVSALAEYLKDTTQDGCC